MPFLHWMPLNTETKFHFLCFSTNEIWGTAFLKICTMKIINIHKCLITHLHFEYVNTWSCCTGETLWHMVINPFTHQAFSASLCPSMETLAMQKLGRTSQKEAAGHKPRRAQGMKQLIGPWVQRLIMDSYSAFELVCPGQSFIQSDRLLKGTQVYKLQQLDSSSPAECQIIWSKGKDAEIALSGN